MATLVSALQTEFTPAAGDFIAQSTGGVASLLRKGSSGAAWAACPGGDIDGSVNVSNPVAGTVYKFDRLHGNPVVQADQ
jgi:hypothetical protein